MSIPCIDGMVRNPQTGRWISASGPTARRVFGQNSCVPYCNKRYPFEPQLHQQEVLRYFLSSEHQGILLYWSLGTGKTCGSIMIMDALLNSGYEKAYILTPGSLRENYLSQYCTLCGAGNNSKLHFVTTNYSRIEGRLPSTEDMSNSVIVIDEVHTIINGYRNESPTYVALYNTLINTTGSRFILLSGTPISGDLMDMYHILKLLSPTMFTSENDYMRYFNERRENELLPLLQQVISRVSIPEDSGEFPVSKIRVQPVPISGDQLQEYYKMRDWEESVYPPNERLRDTDVILYKAQKTRKYIAYSMIKSRQLCNMYYPPEYVSDEDIDMRYIDSLRVNAPKIYLILNSIRSTPGKHAIYSQFKTSYGIGALVRILNLLGITYLLFTGDMDDKQRGDVTLRFNSPSNLRGEQYKVILLTEAGAQGQNFLHVRRLYILEQSINELLIQQVMGRFIRFRSHTALEPEERNITVVRMFATTQYASNMGEVEQYATSDFYAYRIGKRRMESVSRMITVLNQLSVTP